MREMSNGEALRWIALLEGMECIHEYCEDKKLKIEDHDLKISALKRYIKEKAPSIENALELEDAKKRAKGGMYMRHKASQEVVISTAIKEGLHSSLKVL